MPVPQNCGKQFKVVSASSGFSMVNSSSEVITDHTASVDITRNGYLYVYCSNESDIDVFFDNLQVIHNRGPLLEETHYYPFGLTMSGISSKAAGKLENRFKFGGNELQHSEFSDGSGLEVYDFNARQFDAQIGRFHSLDPMAGSREWLTPYNYVQNNPILRVDPMGTFDFVRDDKSGEISWDKNANSQESTKQGQTYLGKTLKFEFNSYIDAKSWDGPLGNLPAGDKLTTTVYVTGEENSKGELTGISAGNHPDVGPTPTSPLDNGRNFYPGLGPDQNKFGVSLDGKGGFNINMEQHASVSRSEEAGLNLMGYNIVNVAQKLDVNISSKGNVSISAATDVFPSATLNVNGKNIMNYQQPSFMATHKLPIKGYTPYIPGPGGSVPSMPRYDYSYKPAQWHKRL